MVPLYPAGRVAGTDPGAGTNSAKGAVITVYTSKGNKVAFPDVVADGKSYTFAQAQTLLGNAGYGTVTQSCVALTPTTAGPTPAPVLPNDPRIDRVQSSSPTAGSFNVPGTPVNLGVGKITCP